MVRFLAFLLLLFLTTSSYSQGDLTLSGGVINTANDFQVGHENWARVKFQIENKSSKVRQVKVQFKHASVPGGVYEFELDVQPKTRINHQFPVAMGSASHISQKNKKSPKDKKKKRINKVDSTYKLLLLEKVDGRYLPVKSAKPIECVMDFRDVRNKKSFALITDESVEIGNLSKKLGLGDGAFRMTYIHKGRWPEHWSEYSPYDALIMLDPIFDDKHPLLIRAVKDYVKMGGTVIFAHHNGINNAAKTQFEELLPIVPLQTRTINRIPALQKFLNSEEIYSEFGMTFIDSVAKKNSLVTCKWNEFPVITWKKYGMGLTGAMSISPTQVGFHGTDAFAKSWRYLLDNINRPADMSSLVSDDSRETVNMLNGLTIPGPNDILKYMLVYLVIIILIFGICFKLKKSVVAWVASLAVSAVMTGIIFNKAYSASDGSKDRTAAVLNQIPVIGEAPTIQVYSIFSKNDEKITFKADVINDRFRKLPKIKVRHLGLQTNKSGYKATEIQDVITGTYNGNVASLKEIQVQGLSARIFTKLSRSHTSSVIVPELRFAQSGLQISSKEFPAELSQAELIYLCGANGIIPMTFESGKLSIKPSKGVHGKTDENLRELLKAIGIVRPTLAYAVKGIKEDSILDDTFEVNGMNFYMSPLTEIIGGDTFIPGDFVEVLETSTSLFIYREGSWSTARHMGGKASNYDLEAQLPLGYAKLNPSEVVVDFEYLNQSGNILVDVSLNGKKGQKGDDGLYTFPITPKDLKDGKVTVTLTTSAKVVLTDNLEIHKANAWKVKHLKVGFKGSFKKQQNELRF